MNGINRQSTSFPFIRAYELLIMLDQQANKALKIIQPLKIDFTFSKADDGKISIGKVAIYNLNASHRVLLADCAYNRKNVLVKFSAGYVQTGLKQIFCGSVTNCEVVKNGADIITGLEIADGGFDFQTATISATVTSRDQAINELTKSMPHTEQGVITRLKKLARPKVLIGFSFDKLKELMGDEERYFIENQKLYVLKKDEVINTKAEVIKAATGLLTTPAIDDKESVSFECILNPRLSIGTYIVLESAIAPHLNGSYKITRIDMEGSSDDSEWKMKITCVQGNFKVVSK